MPGPQSVTRVLVGVHDGGLNGIDTYAEQVALAAAAAGHAVTLLATTPEVARDLRARHPESAITVVDLSLRPPTSREALAYRVWPGLARRRVERGLVATLGQRGLGQRGPGQLGETYPVAHLNHPGLAPAVRPFATRVCVAAWFYPHALVGRVAATWHHTGGPLPRRVMLAAKSISHYRNDAAGYRSADVVLAPTEMLAAQLRGQGIAAVVCPPPVQVTQDAGAAADSGGATVDHGAAGDATASTDGAVVPVRLVVCCGDLSHPRKHVGAALRAVCLMPRGERPIVLELIGRHGDALAAEIAGMPEWVAVERPGALPAGVVHAHMRAADALLLPSLFEEWGYVAVEALLSGTPVVTFPVYPFADMIAPGFGARADDMTPAAYAAAIQRVLVDGRPPDLAARANERFGAAATARRLASVWSEASTAGARVEARAASAPEGAREAGGVDGAAESESAAGETAERAGDYGRATKGGRGGWGRMRN